MDSTAYFRIGTVYFKHISRPLAFGDKVEGLIPWSLECWITKRNTLLYTLSYRATIYFTAGNKDVVQG